VHVFLDDAVIKATDLTSSPSLIIHEPRHFRLAAASDGCQHCDHGVLESTKAIEVAHTFYLGTKYSSTLGCTFLHNGRPTPAEMGCYGIGISRLLASVAESRTDDRGLVWPSSIAPYKLCLITTDDKRDTFKSLATQLYDQINNSHTWKNNVVLDDRRTGFGRKMTDAEMVGYPWIVVVGRKAFNEENPMVEIHQRRLNEPNLKIDMPLDVLGQWLADEKHSPSNLK
jgi:prolyl-tRNA synthetase